MSRYVFLFVISNTLTTYHVENPPLSEIHSLRAQELPIVGADPRHLLYLHRFKQHQHRCKPMHSVHLNYRNRPAGDGHRRFFPLFDIDTNSPTLRTENNILQHKITLQWVHFRIRCTSTCSMHGCVAFCCIGSAVCSFFIP